MNRTQYKIRQHRTGQRKAEKTQAPKVSFRSLSKLWLTITVLAFGSSAIAHEGNGSESMMQHAIEHAYIVLPLAALLLVASSLLGVVPAMKRARFGKKTDDSSRSK